MSEKPKKESSVYEELRNERLAMGMPECPKCHFVQQYIGQKHPHFNDCPVEQERLREQKDLDDFTNRDESNHDGKNLAEKMSENWAEE